MYLFKENIKKIIKTKQGFQEEVKFDSELFFNFILPPIIFAAGYNVHQKNFFDNIGIITYHGLFCTIITFLVLSAFALLLNESNLIGVKFGEDEILLLTATLCATVFIKYYIKKIFLFINKDTVAALTLVKE